jgi:hypothetical protein
MRTATNPEYAKYLERLQRESDTFIEKGYHPFIRLQKLNELAGISNCEHEFLMVSIRGYHQTLTFDKLQQAEDSILAMSKAYIDFVATYTENSYCIKTHISRDIEYGRWTLKLVIQLPDVLEYETFLVLLKLHELVEWQSLDVK